MTTQHEEKKHETSACELCTQNMSCSNLYTALRLLSKIAEKSQNPEAVFQYEDFKRRLEHLKFHYPDSKQSCLIAHNSDLARELVQESIHLIDVLNQKVVS